MQKDKHPTEIIQELDYEIDNLDNKIHEIDNKINSPFTYKMAVVSKTKPWYEICKNSVTEFTSKIS